MFLSLLNLSIVLLLLLVAIKRIQSNPIDIVLAVFAAFWGVAVSSGLLLSFLHLLGTPWAWFTCSILVSSVILSVSYYCRKTVLPEDRLANDTVGREIQKNSRFDVWIIILVTASLFLINVIVALSYPPTNWDTNTYHLPRAFFYMSQGHLGHFPTVNFRQTFLTFNPTLLIIWLSVFELSENLLVLVNPLCWVICFLGIYRLSVLCGASKYSSLAVAAIGCLAPEVYTQGASTTTDIQQASLIICSAVFLLLYIRRNATWGDGMLVAVSFGVAMGIKVTCFFFGPILFIILFGSLCMNGLMHSYKFLNLIKFQVIAAGILVLWFALPFMVYNFFYSGELMTPHYDYLRNKPFEIYSWLQTMYTFAVQAFAQPFKFLLDEQWLEAILKKFLFPFSEGKYAFNALKIFTPGISEDSVWFSFTPYFLMIAVVNELRHKRYWVRPSFICLLASLSWFVTYCAVSKWGMYNHRYFISAFLLAMPAMAMLCDHFYRSNKTISKTGRYAIRLLFLFIIVQIGVCHRYNYYRPIMPVLHHNQTSKALDILPPKMLETLAARKAVNIVQYSWQHQDERLYPFIRVMPEANFTLKQYRMEQKPDNHPQVLTGFNFISFWGTTEGSFLTSIPASLGWTVIPVVDKKSPGIKPLGYVGSWYTDYYKYFSFEPEAKACLPGENNILFLALHDRNNSAHDGQIISRFQKLRLITIGLNEKDELTLTAYATLKDGTYATVWDINKDGYKDLLLPSECINLIIELKDATGKVMGRSKIVAVPFTGKIQKNDIAHLNLVQDPVESEIITVKGMSAYSEGPYTAQGLPKIRWSTDENVSFSFDNDDQVKLEKIFLDLEFQPQAIGEMKIGINGEESESHTWNDTSWQLIHTVVSLKKGHNTISLNSTYRGRSQEVSSEKALLMFREIQFRGYPYQHQPQVDR
ncbi:MAG: hypothetical protein VR65_03710 [Desulfobulbaceae bacterium BRH_c16a]|nr:MAG: hypothetical protein VR65_03710 [Desulfobulbaceae bacterium BRH_c16a]